jgi:hypothetical protein
MSYRGFVLVVLAGLLALPSNGGNAGPAAEDRRINLPLLTAAGKSSQVLIAEARAAGTIDYATSLLYRAYATFGDDRLPTAYHGLGPENDTTLLDELETPNQPLSAAQQALLLPFLVRPGAPGSIFNPPDAPSLRQATVCPRGWASVASATHAVKVWTTCKPGDAASHTAAISDASKVVVQIDELWADMVALMGEPLADNGGTPDAASDAANDDTKIDIYLLPTATSIRRDGVKDTVPNRSLAAATSSAPFNGVTASGYIMVPRSAVAASNLKARLAHEFFHVLQNRYNDAIAFQNGKEFWFVEASATWAEAFFVPETAAVETHYRFTDDFQTSDLSLHTPGPEQQDHAYAAYIWPFFMQQETGGPQAIARAWQAIGGVSSLDWNQANAAISAQLPFETNFRRFAIRNINRTFDGDNPIGTRYKDLDPKQKFPDGVAPVGLSRVNELRPTTPPALAYEVFESIPSLAAVYSRFKVDDTIGKLEFDLSGLDPADDLNIDALIKIRGRPWVLRELSGSTKLSFCRNRDPVEQVILILSNHNPILGKNITGAVTAKAQAQQCSCEVLAQVEQGWRGTINISVKQDLTHEYPDGTRTRTDHVTIDRSVALDVELIKGSHQPGSTSQRWYASTRSNAGSVRGTVEINDRMDTTYRYETYTDTGTNTVVGGPDPSTTQITLDLDLIRCNYSLYFSPHVPTVYTDRGGGVSKGDWAVVILQLDYLPLRGDNTDGEDIGDWAAAETLSVRYNKRNESLPAKRVYGMYSFIDFLVDADEIVIAPADVSFDLRPITSTVTSAR